MTCTGQKRTYTRFRYTDDKPTLGLRSAIPITATTDQHQEAVVDLSEISVIAVPSGDETTVHCSCCQRPIYEGAGDLQSTAGTIAVYWYRWPEGHEGRFTLAVGRITAHGDPISGVLVVVAYLNAEQITYTVLEPENSRGLRSDHSVDR